MAHVCGIIVWPFFPKFNANKTKSILVTTQKDYVRIPKPYRSLVNILEGEIIFENEELLIEILSNVIENRILIK